MEQVWGPAPSSVFPCPVLCAAACRVTFQQILKLPALERDGARNPNPQPFYDKI